MDAKRRRLKDELQSLQDDRELEQGQIGAAETQRNLIQNLTNLPTRPTPVPQPGTLIPTEDWPQILSFIGSSINDINRTVKDAKVRMREIDRKIKDIRIQLSELAPQKKQRTEVKVTRLNRNATRGRSYCKIPGLLGVLETLL